MKNIPIVTVSCIRDLSLHELQAQSIFNYLPTDCEVYIIVNEKDTTEWFDEFNKSIKKYYINHNLTIFTLEDFQGNWNEWPHYKINPWVEGWERQQALKLLVSTKINSDSYLMLDCQNFLIKSWNPRSLYKKKNKIPIRRGHYVMHPDSWNNYCRTLGINLDHNLTEKMSICTPIFLATDPIKELINQKNGVNYFIDWFKSASSRKSEFILYRLWLEKLGRFKQHHYIIDEIKDWGQPYLRDCYKTDEFEHFIDRLGKHEYHAWASINFRAWGNMTEEQYSVIKEKLLEYNLECNFENFRSNYIDL